MFGRKNNNISDMNCMYDNKVNIIAEFNLLYDILNPFKQLKI